jgi:DNA polymerase II small subunit/DNA polymerase delta subunit B
MIRQKVIKFLIENDILIDPNIIEKIPDEDFNISLFYKKVLEKKQTINSEILLSIISDVVDNNLSIINSQKVLDYDDEIDERLKKYNISLVENYVDDARKKEIGDFTSHYNRRFDQLSILLKNRVELSDVVSISRLKNQNSEEKQKVSAIGMVLEKNETKNNNFIFTLEDKSEVIKVLITKSNPNLYELAKDVMLDEVIGITGTMGDNIIFCDNIFFRMFHIQKHSKNHQFWNMRFLFLILI